MLAKLQTRNIEIQKRLREGKDITDLLPDALKAGGAAAPEARRSSVKEMEDHIEAITEHLGDVQIDEPAEDAPAGAADAAPTDA